MVSRSRKLERDSPSATKSSSLQIFHNSQRSAKLAASPLATPPRMITPAPAAAHRTVWSVVRGQDPCRSKMLPLAT